MTGERPDRAILMAKDLLPLIAPALPGSGRSVLILVVDSPTDTGPYVLSYDVAVAAQGGRATGALVLAAKQWAADILAGVDDQ